MSDWRELVRVAVIETIKNESWVQFENTKKLVENEMNEHSSRIPGYKDDARINIELVVPIQLPPDGKKGDCKRVVETVRDQFTQLSGGADDGGAQIYLTNGSWVSSIDGLNEDQCLIVYTAMPAKSWHKSIPVLRDLIKDEIQGKLLQQCAFIRIDGIPYSGPINLLNGDKLADVRSAADNFGGVDSSCYTLVLKEYSELIEKMNANMSIKGNNNVQIRSKGPATSAVGLGSMAAGGNITVNQYFNNTPDFSKSISVDQSTADGQNVDSNVDQNLMEQNENSDFFARSGDELLVMARTAVNSDNYDIAMGYLKQAIRVFHKAGEEKKVFIAKNNLSAVLASLSRYKESINILLELKDELVESDDIGDFGGVKQTLLMNLGNAYLRTSNFEKASEYYEDALQESVIKRNMLSYASLCINIGTLYISVNMFDEAKEILNEGYRLSIALDDKKTEAKLLQNLASNAMVQGLFEEGEDLANAALKLFRDLNDQTSMREVHGNLALIHHRNKNYKEAISIFKNILDDFHSIGAEHHAAHTEYNLGIIYQDLEEYELSETYLTKSLGSLIEIGDKTLSFHCLIHLSQIAKEKGEINKYEELKIKCLELSAEMEYDIQYVESTFFN